MPNYRLEKGSIQHGFWNSRAKLQMFAGGFGNGKTTALVMKALNVIKDYPGCNILLARATYPKLNDTLRKEFLAWCPADWVRRRPSQDDNTAYMTNGSIVNFRYIAQRGKQSEDGNTTSNLLSATFDFIGVDQVEDPEISHKDFLDLLGRLRGQAAYRPTGADDPTMPSTGPRWIVLTCNPTHNWVYKTIVKPFLLWRDKGVTSDDLIIDEKTQLPIMELFEADTYSNAANLPEDFITTQEAAYRGQMRDRYLLGKWAAFEGLVHPDFSREFNMIKREQMLDHIIDMRSRHVDIKVIEGYDFGLTSPSCYMLCFVDDFGRVFVIDGFHKGDYDYREQGPAIHEIRSRYDNLIKSDEAIRADPAIFKRMLVAGQSTGADTVSKLFKEMNVSMRAAGNDILPGIAKMNAYISGRWDTPHIITDAKPGPMLYIADDLDWFEDEILAYYWKKDKQGGNTDEPIDRNDHGMNTCRYVLSKQPHPAEVRIDQKRLPPSWMYWQEKELRT